MNRMMAIIACVALVTGCCMAKTGRDKLRCVLWEGGEQSEMSQVDSLAAVSLQLLAKSDDQLRLLVTPEMIASIKASDTALEVVFPDSVTTRTSPGAQDRITRILIPLSGEYGPPPELSSAVIFFGTDTYVTGPSQNNFARPELLRLLELLKH